MVSPRKIVSSESRKIINDAVTSYDQSVHSAVQKLLTLGIEMVQIFVLQSQPTV